MQEQHELHGTVDRLLFHNEENGFAVFVLNAQKGTQITVKGYVPSLRSGELVTVRGSWVTHPKFGKQFEAAHCVAHPPTSTAGLKKYLASGLIKGIGPTYAEKIVNHFGTDVLEIIDKDPTQLSRVPGIGKKRVEMIIDAWQDQKEVSHIMVFLQSKGVSTGYATKIYKKYGNDSIARVTENPYRLAEEIWGIGFKTADQIAQNLGFAPHSIKRIRAGILYALTTNSGNGNLYCTVDEAKSTTRTLLELADDETEDILKRALHELYEQEKIKLISYNDAHYICQATHYYCEKAIAQRISALLDYPRHTRINQEKVYQQMRSATDIDLNEDQQRAIMNCVASNVSIVTGGPGTGKTTILKQLLRVFDAYRIAYKLAAPTGRAAKRMQESTGKNATTIHRLLEFDASTMGFARNEAHALALDVLIIDEASMIDVFLAHAILKAVPLGAQLIFIGDVDQLPSVGPGNLLYDLIQSGKIPTVRLTHIFRQAQNSMIIHNAHRVNHGEFPTSAIPEAKKDFIFIKEELPENVPGHLESIYRDGIRRFGISSDDTMVLVPMHRGQVGTQKLNGDLQAMLNGAAHDHLVHHGSNFKVGDRVMQLRNNYDKLIFNGDIGTIERVDVPNRTLEINFFDRPVLYEANELDELVLAYAISIHKSQGSEYAAAIIPIFTQHFTLLQRNLLYTAITRAKKLCILIGQPRAIAMAVKNNKGRERVTFLTQFLTTDLQCR